MLGEAGKLRGVIQPHIEQALDAVSLQCAEELAGAFLGKTDAVDLHWSSSSSAKSAGCVLDQRLAGFGGHRFVGFQAAVAANVEHGVAALGEHAADEQAAMAVGGVFLAANQRHAEALHAGSQAARWPPGKRASSRSRL